ncbi:ATP-dependent sacrificial sulfur transferase LarE [Tautonia sp. JC769]|uniref:ATP-dependent sacrificial sulfur transferase LarE n=1 Tax=Tautonia sp. JC769 TaxID=3232135 RepID=UPI0034589475
MSDWNDPELAAMRDRLIATLRGYGKVAVAFSGGIDSTVVAQAAHLAIGADAIAVTAVSDSLAEGEREEAESLARQIGIRHRVIHTSEFEDPNYLRNNPDRCYFCKSELYGRLALIRAELGVDAVASGANLDDAGDHRPGMKAASENGVVHPLLDSELTKDDVRKLAKAWGLPTWDKPATPCLSSRIAYGEEVTPERTRMIDQAERWLRARGLRIVRVRYHKGDMARVEVPLDELPAIASAEVRTEMVRAFKDLGFKFVTLDLEGFRSGSNNLVIPSENLMKGLVVPASAPAAGR